MIRGEGIPLNGIEFNDDDVIYIDTLKQGTRYWLNNVKPIEIFVCRDIKDREKAKFVFVFRKKDTKEVYKLWQKRELL